MGKAMGGVLATMISGAILVSVAAVTLAAIYPHTARYYSEHPRAGVTAEDIERLATFIRSVPPYENTEGNDPAREDALRTVGKLLEQRAAN